MARKPPRTAGLAKHEKRGFRVSSTEKAQLITAVKEADRGGALLFDEAMAEVRRLTDHILVVAHAPSLTRRR